MHSALARNPIKPPPTHTPHTHARAPTRAYTHTYILQTASSSSYYYTARDPITVIIIFTIASTIIYYATVLFTEVGVLSSERARRRLIAAGSQWKKSGLLSSQARFSGTFDPGQVSNAVNPTFLKVAAPGDDAGEGIKDMAVAIQSTTEPPSRQLWATFQSSMQGMLATINETGEQLRALVAEKEALEFTSQAAANSLAVGKAGAVSRSAVTRKEFAATTRRVPAVADVDEETSSPNPLRAARAGALSGTRGGGSPGATGLASPRGLSAAREAVASNDDGGTASSLDSPNPLRVAAQAKQHVGTPQTTASLLQGYRSKRS